MTWRSFVRPRIALPAGALLVIAGMAAGLGSGGKPTNPTGASSIEGPRAAAEVTGDSSRPDARALSSGGGPAAASEVGSSGSAQRPDDPFPADFVVGSPFSQGSDDPRPEGCSLRRGVPCTVVFKGQYRVSSVDTAKIRLAAHENGSDLPTVSKEIPVVKGSARFFDSLVYTPGAQATTVRFVVTLVSDDGKVLHQPEPAPPDIPIFG